MSRWRADRGASAVEFAIVAPLLLLIVFATVDFGRLVNAQIKATEAAREGARAAAVAGPSTVRSAAASSRAREVDSRIRVVSPSTYCDPPYTDEEDATVHTELDFDWITPVGSIAALFGGPFTDGVTVTGKGVMPCRA